jgi:transposase
VKEFSTTTVSIRELGSYLESEKVKKVAMESTATTKGNKHLRAIIVQVAWAASRTKGSFFMDKFTKLMIRKSRKKALVAIGRKILFMPITGWNQILPRFCSFGNF